MSTRRAGFAKFYHGSRDDRLRAVLVSAGDLGAAQDLVTEAVCPGLGVVALGVQAGG